jgi:hypothetical protein
MDAFNTFDTKGKNIRKLLKSLGTDFKWGYLTSKIGKTYQKFELPKINGLDTIKVINVSPNGATRWRVALDCK